MVTMALRLEFMSPSKSKSTYNHRFQEFIIVYLARVVSVEQAKHTLILLWWNGDAEIVESFAELVEVESLCVVIVHNLENTHDAIDASCTS